MSIAVKDTIFRSLYTMNRFTLGFSSHININTHTSNVVSRRSNVIDELDLIN